MYNGDIMAKRRDPNSRHYVDNKEFLEAITEYREKVLAAKESGEEKPRVPEYLGECMVKIANHLAYKSNFVNYTFRDEMILDGIVVKQWMMQHNLKKSMLIKRQNSKNEDQNI